MNSGFFRPGGRAAANVTPEDRAAISRQAKQTTNSDERKRERERLALIAEVRAGLTHETVIAGLRAGLAAPGAAAQAELAVILAAALKA